MEAVCVLTGAVKRYAAGFALGPLDLSLYAGELLGVQGRNGAGKSTLLGVLAGALPLSGGERRCAPGVEGRVAYVPQELSLYRSLTVREAQRRGNLLVLLSLTLGGVLRPWQTLPAPLRALGALTLPRYAALGVEAVCRSGLSGPLPRILLRLALVSGLVSGLGAAAALLPALPVPALPRRSVRRTPRQGAGGAASPLRRCAGLARLKLRAVSGGPGGLAALLLACTLCGLAASGDEAEALLRVGLCDLDESALSAALTERLRRNGAVDWTACSPEEGEWLLATGQLEGLLTVGQGYEQAMEREDPLPLRYDGASAAVTASGVRELVAGQVVAQRCRLRALRLASERLERPLGAAERDGLMEAIEAADAGARETVTVRTAGGSPVPDPFSAPPMGFAALVILLTLLSAAPWAGEDERGAEARLRTLPGALPLSLSADCLALTLLGCAAGFTVLLFCGAAYALPAAACFSLCAAALSQLLARLSREPGRVDGLAPFLALGLCLTGGCFSDLTALSPALRLLGHAVPPGLALSAARGSAAACLALIAEAAAFFLLTLLGAARREKAQSPQKGFYINNTKERKS